MSSTRPRRPPGIFTNGLPHGQGRRSSATRSPVRYRNRGEPQRPRLVATSSPSTSSKTNSDSIRWTPSRWAQLTPVGPSSVIPVWSKQRTPSAMTERSEEHTSELQSRLHLVCRLLLEKKNNKKQSHLD